MNELSEIINLVGGNKIKNIDVVMFAKDSPSKVAQLYFGLGSNSFDSEDQAITALFGDDPKAKYKFNRVKAKLMDRLYNTLFFIDVNAKKNGEVEAAYYDSYRKFAVVKILIGKGARRAGIGLAEKLLKTAQEFEFLDLVVDLLRVLRVYYGSIVGDKKKYRSYNKLLKNAEEILRLEILAEEYYLAVVTEFVSSQSNQDVGNVVKKYSEELGEAVKTKRSHKLIQYSYYISLIQHQIRKDYQKLLTESFHSLEAFKGNEKLLSKSLNFNINFNILICLRSLNKKEAALERANICYSLVDEGNLNWFLIGEQVFLLRLHHEDYQEGVNLIEGVVANKNYKGVVARIKQQFSIYEAYCNFLVSRGKASFSHPDRSRKKFRLGKFLNQVPVYSKDKRGTNIQIIIIQILTLLDQHKYGQVIDKVEALNMYCHRYLRKNDTFRSNCFIKMLLQLPAARFNRVAAQRKAQKYYNRLLEMPLEKASQSSELEIIPYETLWVFVLEMLGDRHY